MAGLVSCMQQQGKALGRLDTRYPREVPQKVHLSHVPLSLGNFHSIQNAMQREWRFGGYDPTPAHRAAQCLNEFVMVQHAKRIEGGAHVKAL
jgi:hypothetical protein